MRCATSRGLLGPLRASIPLKRGIGVRTSVLEVANCVNEFYGGRSEVRVTGEFRGVIYDTAQQT